MVFRRHWKIFHIDKETGEATIPVVIEGILENWNFSGLSIPKLFLKEAKYKLIYTVIVKASRFVDLTRNAFTFIEVIPVSVSK